MTGAPRTTPAAPRGLPPNTLRVLLVEGEDDKQACKALRPALFSEAAHAWVVRGGTNFVRDAKVLANDPQFVGVRAVAVLLDAEHNPQDAWDTILAVADALGFPRPPSEGVWVSDARGAFGALRAPTDGAVGSLETVVRGALSGPRSDCVDALFTCAGSPVFGTQARQDKAWLDAWYATLDHKGERASQLTAANGLDATNPGLANVLSLLDELLAR